MKRIARVSLVTAALISLSIAAGAAPLDKVQFIKVSAQEGKAVIRGADGKMTVVRAGATVAENITVKDIIPGRIILEEKTSKGLETIVVRLEDNGKARIERLRKHVEKPVSLAVPAPVPAPAPVKK